MPRARTKIQINRAPVLTLWAAVVAERLGHSPDESLSLAKALAGLNAHSKGVRLGLYDRPSDTTSKRPRKLRPTVTLLGRPVPTTDTPAGPRAVSGSDKPISPQSVTRYLANAFGPALPAARAAMESLAASLPPRQLDRQAYALYEQFRPTIPPGKRGWGAKGELDLRLIRSLAKRDES